jgi:rubrerythrin
MDPVHFSGKEILEMAVRIEENGERFYTQAAGAAKTERLKELFSFLADEEKKHIAYFKEMKRQAEGPRTIFDPYIEEAGLYLKAVADTEVFTRPDEGESLAQQVSDEKEALDIAIDMEKESLLFYYEFIKGVRESDRSILDRLIIEEKVHLKKLMGLKKELFG